MGDRRRLNVTSFLTASAVHLSAYPLFSSPHLQKTTDTSFPSPSLRPEVKTKTCSSGSDATLQIESSWSWPSPPPRRSHSQR